MDLDFPLYFAPPTDGGSADTATADADTDTADTGDNSAESESSAAEGAGGDSAPDFGDTAPDNPFDIDTLRQKGDLEESMAEIGGNLGRSQPDEDTESEEPEGETDEDEQPESEAPSEDAEAGAPDEAEAEGEDEDTEEGDVEDAAEEEPEGEEAEGEPLPDPVQETVNEHFPDRVIETQEQLDETLDEVEETRQIFDLVDRVVEEDDELARYFELRFQEDMDPMRAKIRAFESTREAPDPNEKPEEYAKYKAEVEAAKKEAQAREADEEELDEIQQRVDQQSQRSLERLANKKNWDSERAQEFADRVNTLVFGDPNGNVPSDQMERLFFALNKDKVIEQVREEAFEEGRKKGRNENIEEETTQKRGDGLPKPDGSSTPDEPKSDEEQRLEEIGNAFDQRTVSADDFAL